MNRVTCLTFAAACLLQANPASADIVQDSGQFDLAIFAYAPLGQTFTAVDAQISAIAFAFSEINPGFPNDPVTMSLYAGDGFGGTLIASVSQTLPAVLPSTSAPPQFIDFDFTGVTLTVGEVYTVAVTAGTSPRIAAVYSNADPYAGGHYISGFDGSIAAYDLNFRVTAAVPAPAGLALGLGALSAGLRRRR